MNFIQFIYTNLNQLKLKDYKNINVLTFHYGKDHDTERKSSAEERRKQLVKDVKKKGEGAKVAVRNIRRDGNEMLKKLKKSDEVSEDVVADEEEKLQKITDKFIKKVDEAVEAKTKELLTI